MGSPDQDRIALYLEELARWGARVNLVGSTDHDALRLHLEDSLAAAKHLPPNARVVDLGSGAGFPGLPIVIVRPDLRMTLVDSRERRIHFLRHIARRLELECVIRRTRIELAPAERYQFALIRAVAPFEKAWRLATPWVRLDGEIWIWTREPVSAAGAALVGEIQLGGRGRVLRVLPAAVSRGTS